MLIDRRQPRNWFADCLTLSDVRRALHAGHECTLRILEKERVAVYRLPFGTRYRYLVERETVLGVINRHGTEAARRLRMANSAVRKTGLSLPVRCPHCGQKGRQWRNGMNTAGNREVRCGHCRRCYTLGRRAPLQATCPHCGETTRQGRMQLTTAGNLTVRCGHCRRHYTLHGNPDAAIPPPTLLPVKASLVADFEW